MTPWSLKQLFTVIVPSVKRKIHFFSIGFGTLHATFGGNTKDCVDSGRSGSTSRENGKNGKEKTPNHFITTRFMCEVFLSINVTGDRLWHICNPFFSHMATTLHDKNNFLKYRTSLIHLIWIFIWMLVSLYRDTSWIPFDIERKWKLKAY